MDMAAPMLHNPVGCLVSDLPFVNDRAQTRACEVIRRKMVMKTAMKSTVMLHLRARNGPILLEMLADALGAEFEDAAIVLTGRALESGMAGLLFSSSSGNDDDDRASGSMVSGISSLTTSGIGSHSIHFIPIQPTMPTLNAPDDDDRVGSCMVPGFSPLTWPLTTMQTLDASKVGGSSSMPSIVLRTSTIKDAAAPPPFKFDERAGVGANAVVSEASAKRASTVAPEASAASAVTVASEGSAARGVNLLLMRPVHEAK
jgi:hypothetical protein